jgi:hypothetical protein
MSARNVGEQLRNPLLTRRRPQTTLIYLPPPGVRELEDIVQYTVSDAPQVPIQVNVRRPPVIRETTDEPPNVIQLNQVRQQQRAA